MEKKEGKNRRKWALLLGGVLAATAFLWGCFNPVSVSSIDVPSSDVPSADEPRTSGIVEGEFTITLRVGVGPEAPQSRAVVGLNPAGIRESGIFNIIQVITVDAGTKQVADFQQAVRGGNSDATMAVQVGTLYLGEKYHFLVLVGHRERDYAQEAINNDSKYVYFDKQPDERPPTLLAAGFLEDQVINGQATLSITMKPLAVDTVFTYGGVTAPAVLPDTAGKGIQLPSKEGASIVWTLTGGFATLVDAQTRAGPAGGLNWGELSLAEQKTTLRIDGQDIDTPKPVLGGADHNQIVLDLGERAANVSGSANFKLTYNPPGVDKTWIIRNGVNDQAQDGDTTFTLVDGKIPWDVTKNGNGAAVFSFVNHEISRIDLKGLFPAPVTGAMPVTGAVDGGTYTGTVAWKAVVGGTSKARFEGETVYMATVTNLVAKNGFSFSNNFTVTHSGSSGILHTPGNASKAVVEVLFPKTGVFWEYDGYFSGSSAPGTGDMDSAIDIIRQAQSKGWGSLSLKLLPWPETVNAGMMTDIGGGLSLATSNSPAVVILDGGGKTIELGSGTGSLITVGSGVTLTLRNITFKGSANNTQPLIRVATGGTLVLEDGAVITGNTKGSGVQVSGAASKLVMNGGEISGNNGANAGGGVYMSGGVFEMSGGTISNNARGVYLNGGVFTMNSGTISDSTSGGGVSVVNGTFTMWDGTISVNTNTSNGGGVAVVPNGGTDAAKFIMNGGTISGNTAIEGGGVSVSNGTFNMSGGTIYGNTATNGGGVAVMDADSTFTKTTGTIYGNVAAPLGNTATSEGQAAYVVTGAKKRDSTAGPGDAMDSTKDSTAGGWD